MTTETKEQRNDTHFIGFAGSIRTIKGHPRLAFKSVEDFQTGDFAHDTLANRLYYNIDGTFAGWRYIQLATTTTSSSSSSSSTSSSSTTTP